MSDTALAVHRAFYDAVETGDVDLMATLWVDDPEVSCVHPGAVPLRGTGAVLRSWTVLMANVGYIQFFLTDIDVRTFPLGDDEPTMAVVVCTENILSGEGMSSPEAFSGGKAVCTSILVRDPSGGRTAGDWKFWSRHASPIAELHLEED
ncbi:nuclear transport factor 2 family protein [Aeromicrobium stalagmiti]|uniref:nuclear transport factor 2 family protein n=1 Tax=Aeromicrobium stalagmiti TaxID=2738988 RepID=UPI001568655F|nr:nuclear transport factor 2 family protein [Aeromicrobium stalagmiti]NRQ48590.1 nuclear transport factor 2 family protein [Aeromicrobium stalagmiti]